jgi:PDZ domain-containing secreted protein
MAAPTNAANVKKVLANSEPSTHGTKQTWRVKTIGPQSNRFCHSLLAELHTYQHLLPAMEVCHESQRSDAQGR